MKLAILYAGQGSQHPGMGKDLYERYPAFREAFNAADLDFDLESVCFDDPEGVLNLTQYTQPCMVAFAAGVTAVLKENGVKADDLAGLSLGEYSALEAAGVFTAKQAVELAAFRGKAMADAAKGIECGMTAVMNLDRDALAKCCEEASALGCVQICNYNCPGQLVIGGEKAAVEKAADIADGYLKFWMALEFNRNAGHKVFGSGRAQKEIRKELDDVKFREIRAKSALHEELLHRECQHLVRFYMDLCEKDKNYNSVLCGLITIKKDSAKAKLQRDIYETAILLPQEIGLEEDLDLLTKAAREMYELQFPGERLPE